MINRTKQNPLTVIRILSVLIIFSGLSIQPGNGQADTGKFFKNTIRLNISNPMIFGWKFNVLGYERVIKEYMSASISIGRTAFPAFSGFDTDSLMITENSNDHGFNLSVDYRFYFRNENKYRAPRGVYLGPYYAFNSFSRNQSWEINTSTFTGTVNTDIRLNANLVGVQLGYQFVFWDRIALDLILMGPGWWSFGLKTSFDTDMPPEDEEMLLEKLNEMLQEKFPGSDLVLQGGGFEAKRSDWTSTAGFRYMINIGFRF